MIRQPIHAMNLAATLVSGCLLLTSTSYLEASPAASARTDTSTAFIRPVPPDVAALASESRRLWGLREDSGQLRATIATLEAWTRAAPQDPTPLVLISRATYWYVYLLETGGDLKARKALIVRGLEAAKRAMVIAPRDPAGYLWAATNLGVYGKLDGITRSVSSYGEIRRLLGSVEQLEPDYFHGGLWRYYGRLIDQVPAGLRMVYGYGLDDALEFYRKALTVESRYLQNHLWLAECLLQKGDRAEAYRILMAAVQANPNPIPDLVPENRLFQRKAKELLKREFPKGPPAP